MADDELEGESAGEESEDEESEEEKEEEESEEEAESDEEEEDMEDAVGDDEDEVDDAEEEEESDEDAEEDDADEEETAEALGFVDEDSDDEAERLLSQTSSKTQPRKRQRVNSNGKQETRGAAAAEVKKAAKFEDALKTVKPKPQQKLTRKERRALQRQVYYIAICSLSHYAPLIACELVCSRRRLNKRSKKKLSCAKAC